MNLPDERYSLEVRRRAALEASKNSFDETVETLSRYTGAAIGKRQVEELVGRAAQDFDAFYQRRHQQAAAAQAAAAAAEPPAATGAVPEDRVPEDAVPEAGLLVITSDAKGVVMHRQDLRPATRKASARTRSKLGTRLSKGEKRNRKRMATVAAVYSVASHVRTPEQMLAVLSRDEEAEQKSPPRPRPQHKRVWASLEQEPREVLQEAFREALQRDPQGNQRWVAVVDGNKTQLTILKQLAGALRSATHDRAGHLSRAGIPVEGRSRVGRLKPGAELEQWVLHRLGRVLEGRAPQVAAGMRGSATKRRLATRKREPVDRCANYLLKYQGYLAYDQYLAAGFPIGSGVIEGACRHLVNDRLGITGARWRLRGAEAVLRLRALRSSGDFDDYWRFHEAQEWQRTHRQRYAVHGQVPALQPPNNEPRLRIVRD